MRFFWLLLFLGLTGNALSQNFTYDSLMLMLTKGKADEVLLFLEKPGKTLPKTDEKMQANYFHDLMLQIIAYQLKGDTIRSQSLQNELLSYSVTKTQGQDILKFLFTSGSNFISNRAVYFLIQKIGFEAAEKYQEPRAQFSFLQQNFTMYQMSKQPAALPDILHQMTEISQGHEYLEFLTTLHYAIYYEGIQSDSCVLYFEKYITDSKKWVGHKNPYFLNQETYAAQKDSSIMAGAILTYAKHYIRKGDLKKAGELMVTSVRLIPDADIFSLLKIQNLTTLSTLYADLVHPSLALTYARDAIAISEKQKLPRMRNTRIASAYAYALMADGQYAAASTELTTSFRAFPRNVNCQDPAKQALRLAVNGAYQEDFKMAKSWLDTALQMRCENDAEMRFLLSLLNGLIADDAGQHALARTHFADAEKIAIGAKTIGWRKEAIRHAFNNEKNAGNAPAALNALEKYTSLNDSLYRSGQAVAILDIEAGYQKTIQDERITSLDAKQSATALRLKAQKRYFLLATLGVLLLSALCIIVLRLYRKVKASNVIIQRSVEEKNILLKEIHHRVKNNLQVISSLLKLQSAHIKDVAAIQAIAEGRSRVQSMALLHQNLYTEDNLTGVNMQDYFDNLIQGLFDTYNISPDRVHLHKNITPITLDLDTVVPLGLITNELIGNALKHAFPGNASGNLFVSLYEEASNLILSVRDDGTGFTANAGHEGFGKKLIQSLSRKLEADITTRTTQGTEVRVTIRDYVKAA